jgi:invasion protein IalB
MHRQFLVSLLMASISSTALAEPAKQLAKHGDWEAYASGSGSGKVCYVASLAKSSTGDVPGRKGAYVMITHGPGKSVGVPSITLGYPVKEGSEAEAVLGSVTIKFYTKDDTAWARAADEEKFLKAMQKEKSLVVKAVPAKGKPTQDTYSLAGFPEALKEINKACGVK